MKSIEQKPKICFKKLLPKNCKVVNLVDFVFSGGYIDPARNFLFD